MQLLINAVISSNSRCMQSQPGLIQVHKSPRANNRDSSNGRPTYNEQTKSTIALNSSGSVQSQRETSGPLSHARSQPPVAKILSQQTRGGRGGKKQRQYSHGLGMIQAPNMSMSRPWHPIYISKPCLLSTTIPHSHLCHLEE